MSRRRHFHMDQAGHSITVNVRSGHTAEAEVLVDGKEVAVKQLHGSGTSLLCAELPEEPVRPFQVRIRLPRMGSGTPSCVLQLDGVEQAMPERAGP
ncbi:hypothetical protein NGB36_04230 [Streptomyces sp. RB6PN25]|uniref:Uncharacterized protein n=1 Tax=Streptomyces humicola TaxID=2953240 RepID=A0ABT1PQ55_9ACTN|nr:hypothetical protein [Streptomyces humicola]MCQ4079818.1 hypothetical protein [Streptomyces humicola]